MRHIPASISEEDAKAMFQHRSFWTRLLPEAKQHSPKLPRLECIHFPYYLIEIGLTSSKIPGSILVSVEAWSGAFAFIEQESTLCEGIPPGEYFAPRLSPEEAQKIAIKDLTRSILHKRAQGEKPTPTTALRTECIQYPLWLYYHEVRRGKLSLLVRDAVVGGIVGNRTRNGIIQAFIEKRKV